MQKISASTTTANAAGEFTEGNSSAGVEATQIKAAWLNAIQRELVAVIESFGLPLDAASDTQLRDAIRQLSSPVGTMRNGAMRVSSASQTATFTADEVVVETGLGGQAFRLANYSQTVNLSTTGAGGMDTGSAPASGFVALYAIYNPTTRTKGILAVNATSARVPEAYGGANMPTGYTASALISVYPTNSNSQFVVGLQLDRDVFTTLNLALNTTTVKTSNTALGVAQVVPINAKRAMVSLTATQKTAGAPAIINVYGTAEVVGGWGVQASASSGTSASSNWGTCPIVVAQTLYYRMDTTNDGSYQIYINGYSF